MKKIFAFLLAVSFIAGLCACTGGKDDVTTGGGTNNPGASGTDASDSSDKDNPNASKVLDGSCADIIADVYSRLSDDTEVYLPGLVNTELTAENASYYIGVSEGVPYTEGVASESEIQPVTYSFVVLKLSGDSENYETYRSRIEKNINLGKWVCMGAQEGRVLRINNVVAVIMGSTAVCNELEGLFMALAK